MTSSWSLFIQRSCTFLLNAELITEQVQSAKRQQRTNTKCDLESNSSKIKTKLNINSCVWLLAFTLYRRKTSRPSDEICSSSGRTGTLIVGKRRSRISDKNFIRYSVLKTADGIVLNVACFTRRTLNNRTP